MSRIKIFSIIAYTLILVSAHSNATAAEWLRQNDSSLGQDISKGIPCEATVGWARCGFPAAPPEPEFDECFDPRPETMTMITRHYLMATAEALPSYRVWKNGKLVSIKGGGGSKLHQQYAPWRNLQIDFPELGKKIKARNPNYSKPLDLTHRGNALYARLC